MEIEDMIISSLAGALAEKKYSGRFNHLGAESDRQSIIAFAEDVAGTGRALQKYIEWLNEVAKNIVELRWNEIVLIAEALYEKKTLSYKEIKTLLFPEFKVNFK